MPSKPPPAFPTACSTARQSRSGWRWPSRSPRGAAWRRLRTWTAWSPTLSAIGLPTRISDIRGERPTLDRLMEAIAQDKKVARGSLTFILVRGIGQAFVARDVPPNDVAAFLEERLKL